jgi:hypothetical protein
MKERRERERREKKERRGKRDRRRKGGEPQVQMLVLLTSTQWIFIYPTLS